MKMSLYTLKRSGSRVALVTAGALLLSLTPAFNTPQFAVYAEETKEDVQQQKDEAEAGQAEAEANAAKYQKQVDSLVKTVTELDAQMTDISVQIVEKKQEASDLQSEIDDTQKKLAAAQVSEDNQYEAMKKRIQYLYEEGDVEYIDALLSSASFEDSLNKSEYVDQISSYDQKQLNKLVKTKNDIASYEKTLEKDLADVETVKADLEQKQSDLDDVITQKNDEINKYSGDVAVQQAIAAEFAQKASDLDDKLANIAIQEAAAREAELKRQQEEQRQQKTTAEITLTTAAVTPTMETMTATAAVMTAAMVAAQLQVQAGLYGQFPQVVLSQIHMVQEMLLQRGRVHGTEVLI